MSTVRYIHWNAGEAGERAERIRALGHAVNHALPRGAAFFRQLAEDPPDAVVIDLTRLPSQGRDLGVSLRTRAGTRHVPLVFLEGDPQKVGRIRELLPDAVYATWDELGPALAEAIAHPPEEPVDPGSVFAAYARTPLAQKLGIKAQESTIVLVSAPADLIGKLGELPDGVELRQAAVAGGDLSLWFTRSRAELEEGIDAMAAGMGEGRLWIAWPKKASGVASDLSQPVVRQVGLAAGLVDYKICSIDQTWSALLFTRRT
jgi:hypothetical protein